jgi:glutaredoxin-related protein
VPYGSRNVLEDPDIREGVKKFSEWPTIPQVCLPNSLLTYSNTGEVIRDSMGDQPFPSVLVQLMATHIH